MGGAPIGHVKTLPDDWIARVQAYQPSGPAAPFIERIKMIVAKLGEKSIALERVQGLVPAACGFTTAPPFQGHQDVLARLVYASGGEWPIDEPLREYTIKGRIEHVDKDLRSMEAEWRVLDRFISELWVPVPHQRGNALPDWKVRRPCRTLALDAKQKAPMRGTHMLLTWALRGLAHLPDWGFLRQYAWDWSVAPDCRAGMVSQFVDQLLAGKPGLQARLAAPLTYDIEPIAGAPDLQVERYDDETFLLTCCSKDETVSVTASPTSHPSLFNPGGVQTSTIDDVLSDKALDELAPVLGRVGLDKKQPSLVVLIWPIPFDWEPIYERSRIEAWWQEACDARGWSPAILWPLGHFEARATPWPADAAAKESLGCNLSQLASVVDPHRVVRWARPFVVRS